MIIFRHNHLTRLETRTKEFNWNVRLIVLFYTIYLNESKIFYIVLHIFRYMFTYKLIKYYTIILYYCIILIKHMNILVETRKMVNYTWTWWSQVKTWWKLALCGTDVQIVTAWFMYRGERLIEPSSSWFPSKFPSG